MLVRFLALGTSNRLGRVVDRTRVVASDIAASKPGSEGFVGWDSQLRALEIRVHMLLRALRLFYAALGLFASSALISVAGSMAAYYGQRAVVSVGRSSGGANRRLCRRRAQRRMFYDGERDAARGE